MEYVGIHTNDLLFDHGDWGNVPMNYGSTTRTRNMYQWYLWFN